MAGPRGPIALRLASGRRADRVYGAGAQMELYSECVHRGAAGLVEVTGAVRDGKRLRFRDRGSRESFLPAGARVGLRARGARLSRAGMEVFVTPATLTEPEPGNDAVAELAVVWVDLDDPAAIERLRAFAHRPHLVVASGSGGVHAYWRLSFAVPAREGESANRRLAAAIGGDPVATNAGRLLRLAGTWNRKQAPPAPCRILGCDLARRTYDPRMLIDGLADPRPRASRRAWGADPASRDDPAARLAPPEYFRALAGIEVPERGGLVSCPHRDHADRNPSAMVYAEPGAGWFCFACSRGGGVYDLASALLGGPTGAALRGEAFREARAVVRARLGSGGGGRGAS